MRGINQRIVSRRFDLWARSTWRFSDNLEREREKRRGEKSKKERPLDNKERCNIIGFYFSRLSQDIRLSSLSVGSSRFNFWDKEFSLSLSLFFSLCWSSRNVLLNASEYLLLGKREREREEEEKEETSGIESPRCRFVFHQWFCQFHWPSCISRSESRLRKLKEVSGCPDGNATRRIITDSSWRFTKAIVNSYSKQIADIAAVSCLRDDPANLADPTEVSVYTTLLEPWIQRQRMRGKGKREREREQRDRQRRRKSETKERERVR